MAKRLQHRGGTTAQHSTFTGAVREVTVDTDKNTLVVHDGATAGGHPLATATNFTSTGIDDNATSTAVTIDSSGDVGINISSPNLNPFAKAVTLSSGGATNCGYELAKGSTLHGAVALQGDNRVQLINFQDADITFNTGTSPTERMRIVHSTNRIGIGTSSPNATLDVRGSAIFNEGGSDVDFRVESNNQANMLFVDGGNDRIGIGTNSPQAKLSIAGAGGSLSGASSLSFYDTNSASSRRWSISNGAGGNETSSIGQLFFSVGEGSVSADPMAGTAVMVLTKTARVGIGTSSPSQKLDVVGSIEVSDGIYIGGTGTANKLDDYEEGSWTPVCVGSTTAGTVTMNGSYTRGRYTKIGNTVYIHCVVVWSSLTGTGNLRITGLPFTSRNIGSSNNVNASHTSYNNLTVPSDSTAYARIFNNSSEIGIASQTTGTSNIANLTVDATGELYFNITYTTDA